MISFTYDYDENGWATSHISDSVNDLDMYPSLVTGGDIEDLAERVVVLLKLDQQGISTKQKCSWGDEPGEYRWILKNDNGNLSILILWFDAPHSHLNDEQGKVLFSAECSLIKFAIQVKTELRDALETLGEEEYEKRARKAFPQRIYDELRSLIRAEQLQHRADSKR
jgi:hypothetical protein